MLSFGELAIRQNFSFGIIQFTYLNPTKIPITLT